MPRIRLLSEEVHSRIAAGEVVERPASVVKELVENALDAGASRIEVELEEGGLQVIRVSDDGEGMDPEDLRICWHSHATSKIASAEDLLRIHTFGFRGEALYSIAQVSRLTIVSRPRGSEEAHILRVAFGREEAFQPFAGPPGTTVTVEGLFQGFPARRAFLRGPRAEAGRVLEILRMLALGHPEVSYRFRQGGRETFRWPGGSRRKLLAQILRVPEEQWLERTYENRSYRLELILTRPEAGFSTTRYLFLLVNDRVIRDRALMAALLEGLRAYFPGGRFPAGVVALYLPPHLVDVNVHPAKWEVRFREEREVFRFVKGAAEKFLARTVPKPPSRSLKDLPLGPPPKARSEGAGFSTKFKVEEPLPGLFPGEVSSDKESFRCLGFLRGTYAVFETPEGLLLLDFHAAHERLLYEKFRKEISESERLLFPAVFELSEKAREQFENLGEELESAGFRVREAGPREILVEGVPSGGGLAAAEELRGLLEEGEASPENFRERLAARLACRLARKAGEDLTVAEAEGLLREIRARGLERCPHGRPLYLLFSWHELEKRFGRKP